MSPPENSVFAGASQRATGSKKEGRVGRRGVGAAKAARADDLRGAPRALGVAWRCVGAPEVSVGGAEGALMSCCGGGISDGRHH